MFRHSAKYLRGSSIFKFGFAELWLVCPKRAGPFETNVPITMRTPSFNVDEALLVIPVTHDVRLQL